MVLKSFARLGCCPCGKSSTTRTGRAGSTPCFRIVSAPTSAGRSRGPALTWWRRDALCVYRAARNIFCHHSVGADSHIGPLCTHLLLCFRRCDPRGRPPGHAPHPLQKSCHCEASAHTGCGERSERRQWRMKRGNRRSAACGRISEAISRKCPDWRARQWPGIGWHDGGPERVVAVKIGGARRKAAQKFWAPQQGHPRPHTALSPYGRPLPPAQP